MFIILHCRVLFVLLFVLFWYIFLVYLLVHLPCILLFCTAFIGSPCCNVCLPSLSWFIPVQFTAEPMCNRYRTENKTYQHLIPKAVSLSLLSTTIGPEHEPLLPNRVVNPQQCFSLEFVVVYTIALKGGTSTPIVQACLLHGFNFCST